MGHTSNALVSQLLFEMDCAVTAEGFVLAAATNARWAIDEALLRPGRLEHCIHVPLPDAAGRQEILGAMLNQMALHSVANADVLAQTLAATTRGCSGADLSSLCQKVATGALSWSGMHGSADTSSGL